MKVEYKIPNTVSRITETLKKGGFKAYLVGGCVRDIILGKQPKDWDITTNAKPEEIVGLFEKTFYENAFGTVTVVSETEEDETLKNVEITPFRLESKYTDKRHPDNVKFSDKIEDDLKRRDFTINALAYDPETGGLIDLYEGIKDLKDSIIRTVGEPTERFSEDPLRVLRAVRFATQLSFTINMETEKGILESSDLLSHISIERIRDEFVKMIMSDNPMFGLNLSHKLGVMKHVVPEMEEGIDMAQNSDHIYTVWEHTLRALQHAADKQWPLHVRLAALFHDIGKPRSRRWSEEKSDWTFYGHDVVSERITEKVLNRLKLPGDTIELVVKLVRNHMFFSDPDKISLSAVRRIIVNVGRENIWDLMKVRACDRIGMGRPKENPYRLRKYEAMIEEAMRAPTSVQMLKIDGNKVIEVIRETPGPKIGFIMKALLEEALEDPDLNTPEYLEKRTLELNALSPEELKKLALKGEEKAAEVEEKELKIIKKRHGVQ